MIAGFSAAALHGSKWVDERQRRGIDPRQPRTACRESRPRRPYRGGRDRSVAGIPVTSPARTALDLGCWYPTMTAVAAIDALARATEFKAADVELLARAVLRDVAASRGRAERSTCSMLARNPEGDWLRVVLVQAGLPRPQTQIPVLDEFGECDRLSRHGLGGRQSRGGVRRRAAPQRSLAIQLGRPAIGKARATGWIVIRVRGRGSAGRHYSPRSRRIGPASVKLASHSRPNVKLASRSAQGEAS